MTAYPAASIADTDDADTIAPPVSARHLAAYRARDVDLAVRNIAHVLADGPATIEALRTETLHPRAVVSAALAVLVAARRVVRLRGRGGHFNGSYALTN